MKPKIRANRNQTLSVRRDEIITLKKNLLSINKLISVNEISNKTINQDLFDTIKFLPENFIDLLFIDPPYNLTKNYNGNIFKSSNEKQYEQWVDSWMSQLIKSLKKTASIYVCCDWKSSSSIYNVISKYFTVRNRITWEREKGRGAMSNWKNCSEDIWFATVSDNYFFDTNKVKLKKKVIAPYKDNNGVPKDWTSDEDGKFRLTYPSNIWTDITIPFWSMPENTDHPTQKPEKLVAKIILASTKEGDMIFDPFLGSGTTSVVAKKLNRQYCGIEINFEYCLLAEKRLQQAQVDKSIQGYKNGIFWERNTVNNTKQKDKIVTLISHRLF